jgi:hemoglobin/transferrin/lactoferrin receptor protein
VTLLPREVLDGERIARTLPEALEGVTGVAVQKTAHGQGSPFIRGFTGFRTVLLIDGIRLNNGVFRDGPNQYSATVDPFALGRLEVVRGPGAVLYGSDAVGGTVAWRCTRPEGSYILTGSGDSDTSSTRS